MKISFIVPGKPVGKGRPRTTPLMRNGQPVIGKGGRPVIVAYTPENTISFENLVKTTGRIAMAGRPLIEGPVYVRMAIDVLIPASWSGKKRHQAVVGEIIPTTKPDMDNVIKAIFDGLNGITWNDDVQVTDLATRKRYAMIPGVRVEIIELHPAQQSDLLKAAAHEAA